MGAGGGFGRQRPAGVGAYGAGWDGLGWSEVVGRCSCPPSLSPKATTVAGGRFTLIDLLLWLWVVGW